MTGRIRLALVVAAAAGWAVPSRAADGPGVTFVEGPGRVEVRVGGEALATYVYADAAISRPYFAHLRAAGVPVTRNHPPVADKDATDHADMHPGVWLAFGDLSGADHWRNKAKVVQDGIAAQPQSGKEGGSFTVTNRYLAAGGTTVLARETFRCTVWPLPAGSLLIWDSEFRPGDKELSFGDQEEMGLGVRLATPLTAKAGGRITGSGGEVNERQVRGKQLDWCDYAGVIEGRRVGVLLVPDPKNFVRSWWHARDYGLLVANPFARKSLGKGEVSRVVVAVGESLRLRFGVLVHSSPADKPVDLAATARNVLAHLEGGR